MRIPANGSRQKLEVLVWVSEGIRVFYVSRTMHNCWIRLVNRIDKGEYLIFFARSFWNLSEYFQYFPKTIRTYSYLSEGWISLFTISNPNWLKSSLLNLVLFEKGIFGKSVPNMMMTPLQRDLPWRGAWLHWISSATFELQPMLPSFLVNSRCPRPRHNVKLEMKRKPSVLIVRVKMEKLSMLHSIHSMILRNRK